MDFVCFGLFLAVLKRTSAKEHIFDSYNFAVIAYIPVGVFM